jgi:protein-tyrosine phosphatase
MTLEHLEKQKEKYQNKQQYFLAIGFDGLANDFQKMVDLIGEMEEYIKKEEKSNASE